MEESPERRVCPVRETPDGFHILSVHYSAMGSDYDFEAACRGMAPEDIATELEISWSSAPGLRVYPQFKYEIHVATDKIRYEPSLPLAIGWDFGLSPACSITQLNALGQWCIFPSFHPEEREFEGLYEFGAHVADHLLRNYANPNGMTVAELPMIHFGDPAGRGAAATGQRQKNASISAFQILNRGIDIYAGENDDDQRVIEHKPGWGWHLMPGAVSVPERIEAVRARLTLLLREGLPALIVDPREEFIITAFQGGYRYKQFADGTFDRHPLKDHFSHVMDCLGYTASRLWATGNLRRRPGELDEDIPKPEPFISQASGAYRR